MAALARLLLLRPGMVPALAASLPHLELRQAQNEHSNHIIVQVRRTDKDTSTERQRHLLKATRLGSQGGLARVQAESCLEHLPAALTKRQQKQGQPGQMTF